MTLLNKLCLSAFLLSVVPATAFAADPPVIKWAMDRVVAGLVDPLIEQQEKRSRFSRARQPVREYRVRVSQDTYDKDTQGRRFVPFTVDVKYGDEWKEDMTGCVYKATDKIFVKRGEEYRPAAFLLGKKADPVAGVCKAAPAKARS